MLLCCCLPSSFLVPGCGGITNIHGYGEVLKADVTFLTNSHLATWPVFDPQMLRFIDFYH